MFDNAEFVRNVQSDRELPRGTVHVFCYLALASLWFLYQLARFQAGEPAQRLAEEFLVGMLAFHFVVSGFLGLLHGGASIARDKENGTLDGQRLTAQTPMELALGKLLGLTAPMHVVNFLALPAMVASAAMAGFDPVLTLAVYAILTASTFFYCALGLLMSTHAVKGDSGSGNAMVGGILLTAVLCACPVPVVEALTPIPALFHLVGTSRAAERYWPPLAGIGVPVELLTLLGYALATWACLIGVARYLENPSMPPWTRRQMLQAYCGVMALGLAFLLSYPGLGVPHRSDLMICITLFQSFILVSLVGVSIAQAPSRERTEQELWRGAPGWRELLLGDRGSSMPFTLLLAAISNAVPLVVCLSPTLGAAVSPPELRLVLLFGNVITFLWIALACKVQELLTFAAPRYARLLTICVLLAGAMGPLGVGMSTFERFEDYLPLLLVGNPPFVLINLIFSPKHGWNPVGLAGLSILLLYLFASSANVLANRRRTALAAEIDRRRQAML